MSIICHINGIDYLRDQVTINIFRGITSRSVLGSSIYDFRCWGTPDFKMEEL